MYPTPYEKVRLGALAELGHSFPDAVLGLSDHSLGNYTCYAAVSLNASLLEKHFTADKRWPGPDVSISIDPVELQELIRGAKAIHQALGGRKTILPEERPTIAFAYACVVTTRDVRAGEELTTENISVSYTHLDVYKRQLQHGVMHWTYAVTDQPVDVFLLRGPFFQRTVNEKLRRKTVVHNFPEPDLSLIHI